MSETLVIVAVALAAAAIGALAVLLLRGRGNAPDPQVSELARQQTELMGRIAAMADAQQQTRVELTQTLHERLETVSQRMGQSLEASAQKTAETLGTLTTRLSVIDEAQKNITQLSGQVVGLQDILANRQARGAFGEVQLQDIVTNALPPSAYAFQATLGNGKRADCLIHLPNPPGSIVIDAKFALDAYHALRNARDEAERAVAARQFRTDIAKHVADIAERYIVPGETAESALMFMPPEAVHAELHANFGDIVTKSYQARVWIVSPTTLMATLNTVRAVLKDVEMRKQAGVIQKYVGLLMEDVGRLNGRVGNLQRHFEQAEKDIVEITKSTDAISRRGEKIREVEVGEDGAADTLAPAAAKRDLLTG